MKTRIIVLSLVMIATAATLSYASRPDVIPFRYSLEGLPMYFSGWEGRRSTEMDQRALNILGVSDYIRRVYYREGSAPMSLYIGYHETQRTGSSIHSPLNCMPGSGWHPVRNERISIPVNGGDASIAVNRVTIRKGTESQVVLYWYQSQGRVVASEYMGKVFMVLDAMRTNRTDAALVRIISSVPPNAPSQDEAEANAERAAVEFVQALFPLLSDFIPD